MALNTRALNTGAINGATDTAIIVVALVLSPTLAALVASVNALTLAPSTTTLTLR